MKKSRIESVPRKIGETLFRLYSKGCEHAIRALIHVATSGAGERFKAKTICRRARIPEASTRKGLQALVAGGFLEAVRGPEGGYNLTKAPEDITLLSIIKAVDGDEVFDRCILGLHHCNASVPCPLHRVWGLAKDDLLEQLDSTTLRELIVTREKQPARQRTKTP